MTTERQRAYSDVEDVQTRVGEYFRGLAEVQQAVTVTRRAGEGLSFDEAICNVIDLARKTHESGRKLMFIGNGGSAAIASHMAADYSKNGCLRAIAFNDGALLTCLANDYGYEHVFEKGVEMLGHAGDMLVAISSSGRSPNILRGVAAARAARCGVVTLSGFSRDNPLRSLGDLNFYVPSGTYGYVEITHLAICQSVVDVAAGWTKGKLVKQ